MLEELQDHKGKGENLENQGKWEIQDHLDFKDLLDHLVKGEKEVTLEPLVQ